VELISLIALGILSLIAAASSKLVADEFKAWLPSVINHLIGWAIRSLPEDKRERYAEEWQSDIDETPGEIGKLIVGLGLLPAAWKLSRIAPSPREHLERLQRFIASAAADLVGAAADLVGAAADRIEAAIDWPEAD
jgi:hypothetical protein